MRVIQLHLVAMVLIASGAVVRKSGGEPVPEGATWSELVAEAATANPRISAAKAAVNAAEASWRASRGAQLPQIAGSAGASRSDADSTGSESDPVDNYDAALTARQLVFSGGRVSAEIEAGRAEYEAARAELAQALAEISFDLRAAVADLQFAQQTLDLNREIEARRRENSRLVALRYEGGREHKGSLMRSEAALSEARFDAERAVRAMSVSRRNLAAVLGRSDASTLRVAALDNPATPPADPEYEALAVASPLVDQAAARRRIAQASVARARGQMFPEVYLSGSVARRGETFFPDAESWRAGVSLDFPIFTGGARRQELAAAQARSVVADENARATLIDVQREIESAHAALLDDVGNIAVREEFVLAAETRAQIARSQYTSGMLSFDDWDVIENDLISAEKSLVAARRDALRSEASWSLAIGKDVFGEP